MISSFLFNLFDTVMYYALCLVDVVINIVLGVLDVFPDMPDKVIYYIDMFLDFVAKGMPFLGTFMDYDAMKLMLPLGIMVANFDESYYLIMWIIKKFPFLGIR